MRRCLLVLLLLAPPVTAQAPPFATLDAAAKAEFDRQGMVGMAVAAIRDGTVAWAKGYGFEDREKQVPVDPTATSYRWASISKPVTAVAALQLADRGLLDLDADVRGYVPEFPDKGVPITARQLLCHQGGIVHYANGKVVETKTTSTAPHPFADVVTALDRFKESPLVGKPGERQAYSTHGYILLSAVVERAGKQRFADQVAERVAKPLGMTSFRPDYGWEAIPRRAVGYSRAGNDVSRREGGEDVSWKLGGGGFTSPVTDLAAFGAGLVRGGLVTPETERKMWSIAKPADPTGAKPYGLGFFVIERPGKPKLVGHDGSQQKAKTALLLDPTGKRGVAVMTSSEWANPMAVAMAMLEAGN